MGTSYNLSDYLTIARRHWWMVLLALLIGAAAGAEYDRRLPREYVSSASVLVYPSVKDADADADAAAGDGTRAEANLDTEAQLVRSTAVVTYVAQALGRDDLEQLTANVNVEVPPKTSILQIKFTDRSAKGAQAGARAFAQSYLRNREENAKATMSGQVAALKSKVAELTEELARINGRLAATGRTSATYVGLDSQREITLGAINELNSRINQLGTQPVSAGAIIQDSRLPARPVRPSTPVDIAAGGVLGLLLGIAAAGLRERLDRRVRRAAELFRRCGMPVLGEVTDRLVSADDVYPPFGDGGRAFNRLRNEVVASLNPGERVVVVAGASRGCAVTHVAANLAAALARTGAGVVLLGAHTPESMTRGTPLARLLGVAPTPGLSDVLAGKANLGEATQRATLNPTLRVITAGGTASAAGLLQSQALREVVTTLLAGTDYLVIEAPSTSAGADAQSLASLADAAIIAVELKHTRRHDVADAYEQIRRIGTPVLGAVVMPRLKPASGGTTEVPGEPEIAWQKAEGPAWLEPLATRPATAGQAKTGPATARPTRAESPTAESPTAGPATTRPAWAESPTAAPAVPAPARPPWADLLPVKPVTARPLWADLPTAGRAVARPATLGPVVNSHLPEPRQEPGTRMSTLDTDAAAPPDQAHGGHRFGPGNA